MFLRKVLYLQCRKLTTSRCGEKHDESIVLHAENAGSIFTDILEFTVDNLSFLYHGYDLPTTIK